MRSLLIILIFLPVSFLLRAQNLVLNPSFEEFAACPGGHSERSSEFRVTNWRAANAGTPDHFHKCSTGKADVPHNWAGVSDAFDGEGYIGLYAWMDSSISYREYAQCQLSSALIKDTLYILQFRYKLSSYSRYAIDRFGALLTDSSIAWRNDRAPNLEPTFHLLKDSALTEETGTWESGRWQFRAKGSEKILTLGNFYDNKSTRHYTIKFRDTPEAMLAGSAYYYIDDVELYPVYSSYNTEDLIPSFTPDEVVKNTQYVLKNIQFEFDSYKLINTSFDELDQLAGYALAHPDVILSISGHTDDVGGDRYNEKLSLNRAKCVAQYLALQGVDVSRVEAAGYGKKKPLVEGNSEHARRTNRRVEIRFE